MSPVSVRARELHAQHHADDGRLTCDGCRMAASWLIEGRERGVPRPRRSGERVENIRASALVGTRYVGRIIQTPGHRGYLRTAERQADGGIYVCTASGVCTYPDDTRFLVWGP